MTLISLIFLVGLFAVPLAGLFAGLVWYFSRKLTITCVACGRAADSFRGLDICKPCYHLWFGAHEDHP